MQTSIKKWGNSAAIRLPKQAMDAAGIQVDDTIVISLENNSIIIKKRSPLDELLEQVSPENKHEEISTGETTGKEIW